MKLPLLLGLIGVGCCLSYDARAQANTGWLKKAHGITSVGSDYNKTQFSFLDAIAKDNRVIFLGEETHGDGTTTSAKASVINYLIEKHGFDVLVFESQFFVQFRANEILRDKSLRQWFVFAELFRGNIDVTQSQRNDLIPAILKTGRKVTICGADLVLNSDPFYKLIQKDLEGCGVSKKTAERYWESSRAINVSAARMGDDMQRPRFDFGEFENLSKGILETLDKSSTTSRDKVEFMIQSVRSNLAVAEWMKEVWTKGLKSWPTTLSDMNQFYRVRDEQMGSNLNWILKKFPDKKVIVSTSTYHVSRNTHSLPVMIDFLPDSLRKRSFVLPFVAYRGSRGVRTPLNADNVTKFERGGNSLEAYLHTLGQPYAFLDFSALDTNERAVVDSVSMHPLSLENKARWTDVYDGVFFIDTMEPEMMKGFSEGEYEYFSNVLYKNISSKH